LKLQFYRSLGIDITQDTTTGEFNRAVIRSTQRGDVNVVNVDGKLSRSFYAKMFWESM
jgi:kinetochore protein Spc24, fungi type